jgi:DNA repair exonuclease SbcCD nuclease subunit
LFRGRADAIALGGAFPVVVHGISFAQPHAPDSLLPRFKPPVEGAVNIGLLHTSLGGAEGHDVYAPCAATELQASGFNYWALGHIHKRSAQTGRCTIVMPGMPQGRDIGESGAKSVTLATIADDRSVMIEERFTSVAQFESVAIDLTGIADWADLAAALSRHLEQARRSARSEHLVVRLTLKGATPLCWRIRRDHDLLRTEAADRAFVVGKTWIEKIEVACHPPSAAPGPSADSVLELRRLVQDHVVTSAAFRAEVGTIADELRRQLPPELRGLLGSDETGFHRALSALVSDGAEDVLALLHATTEPADA